MSAPCVRHEDVVALRDHPGFHAALERYCTASLARYRALTPIERWMLGDTGRSALSGVAVVLGAFEALTPRGLLNAQPVRTGLVSRGRVRLYLERALANGLFTPADPGGEVGLDTRLVLDDRVYAVMTGVLAISLEALGSLHPEVRPAQDRLADRAFAARLSITIGLLVKAHGDLFPTDGLVHLFLAREGGARLLEALVLRQAADRTGLLESCAVSRTALAAAGACSRVHVNRLMADGEARGLLSLRGGTLEVAPAFSEAAAFNFAAVFAVTRAGALATLAQAAPSEPL